MNEKKNQWKSEEIKVATFWDMAPYSFLEVVPSSRCSKIHQQNVAVVSDAILNTENTVHIYK
jgi:hypothetical protein